MTWSVVREVGQFSHLQPTAWSRGETGSWAPPQILRSAAGARHLRALRKVPSSVGSPQRLHRHVKYFVDRRWSCLCCVPHRAWVYIVLMWLPLHVMIKQSHFTLVLSKALLKNVVERHRWLSLRNPSAEGFVMKSPAREQTVWEVDRSCHLCAYFFTSSQQKRFQVRAIVLLTNYWDSYACICWFDRTVSLSVAVLKTWETLGRQLCSIRQAMGYRAWILWPDERRTSNAFTSRMATTRWMVAGLRSSIT